MNVTVDPDIARAAKRAFKVLDMNMSGFFEQSLALFLQAIEPFQPVLEQAEKGEVDPATLKAAMRAFNTHGTQIIGAHLVEYGQISQEIAELAKEDTDKK